MESKIGMDVIRLSTGRVHEQKQALLDIIEYGASESTPADERRQLLKIVQNHINNRYLISKELSKWEGQDYL